VSCILQVLILAIPPVVPASPDRPKAELEHMQQLASAVDGFSLMTYDYSAGAPGPNFPLPWQEQNVKQLTSEAGGSKGAKGGVLGLSFGCMLLLVVRLVCVVVV
jgi:hypothetical protein